MTTQPNNQIRDHEAEQIVLYSMILENSHVDKVCNILAVTDFFSGQHQIIYKKILDLRAKGIGFIVEVLGHALKSDGKYEDAGGNAMMIAICDSISTDQAVDYYTTAVKRCAQRRLVIDTAQGIAVDGGKPVETPAYLEDARDRMIEATKDIDFEDDTMAIGEGIDGVYEELFTDSEPRGLVRTCIDRIDRVCGGLWPGLTTVLACRPSIGKSTLALNIAVNAALCGKKILLVTLEDTKRFVVYRIMSRLAGIDLETITNKRFTAEEKQRFDDQWPVMSRLPIHIKDTGVMTADEIQAKARAHQHEVGMDLLIVDHLGHIREKGNSNPYEVTTRAAQVMAQTAKDLDVPLLLLHQLNRESTKNEKNGYRPRVSELRESGEVEQLARQIWLIHRQHHYFPKEANPHEMELHVAKNSHGKTCTIELHCDLKYMYITGDPGNQGGY